MLSPLDTPPTNPQNNPTRHLNMPARALKFTVTKKKKKADMVGRQQHHFDYKQADSSTALTRAASSSASLSSSLDPSNSFSVLSSVPPPFSTVRYGSFSHGSLSIYPFPIHLPLSSPSLNSNLSFLPFCTILLIFSFLGLLLNDLIFKLL